MSAIGRGVFGFLKVLGHIAGTILELKFFYIIILLFSLTYFIANYSTIGVDVGLIYSYGIMALISLVLAIIYMINNLNQNSRTITILNSDGTVQERLKVIEPVKEPILNRLSWQPWSPFKSVDGKKRKFLRSPEKLPSMLTAGMIAFFGTVIITLIVAPEIRPGDMDYSIAWNMTIQQLFLVSLTESVVFQGILPLLIEDTFTILEKKTNITIQYSWVIVYTFSQIPFAIMHYTVYGGSIPQMIIVAFLGVIWAFLIKRYGMMAGWWSHWGYNLVKLGIIGGL